MTTTTGEVMKGLVGVVAAESTLSFVNGEEGVLEYVGIPIDELAKNSTFEEVAFLLWNRRLPTRSELREFEASLRTHYSLAPEVIEMLGCLPKTTKPMHALRTAVSFLGCLRDSPDDITPAGLRGHGIALTAKMPTIVATFDRLRKGLPLVEPDSNLTIAENFLFMLNGEKPTDAMSRALDVCLIIHADHGLNASTFTARAISSSESDLFSAISGAVGSLKGPLHGGANEQVMALLKEIGSVDRVDELIRGKMERKEKVMGFGHRVYKTHDPRATYLKTMARDLAEQTGHQNLFDISQRVEEVMAELVAARGIYPNVDFYSATTYRSIGFEVDLFTPIFAVSRVAGWIGQVIEQHEDNRIMRPKAKYIGPHDVRYVPLDQRRS